jgi:hypothetical protein
MAEKALQTRIDKYHQYIVELGYNFQLQKKKDSKAKRYYEQAMKNQEKIR